MHLHHMRIVVKHYDKANSAIIYIVNCFIVCNQH